MSLSHKVRKIYLLLDCPKQPVDIRPPQKNFKAEIEFSIYNAEFFIV